MSREESRELHERLNTAELLLQDAQTRLQTLTAERQQAEEQANRTLELIQRLVPSWFYDKIA